MVIMLVSMLSFDYNIEAIRRAAVYYVLNIISPSHHIFEFFKRRENGPLFQDS